MKSKETPSVIGKLIAKDMYDTMTEDTCDKMKRLYYKHEENGFKNIPDSDIMYVLTYDMALSICYTDHKKEMIEYVQSLYTNTHEEKEIQERKL